MERDRLGARFSIVVVAEGAKPVGGKVSLIREAQESSPSGSAASRARRGRYREADRQRNAQRRARPPAARRRADQLRSDPGHPLRRAGRWSC